MVASIHPIRVRVHEGSASDRRTDAILRLIGEAARPRPLDEILSTLCGLAAEVLRADVVSVYVLEGGGGGAPLNDELVLRANVGFPANAVGHVRLKIGEGLTGLVLECLRPVSVAVAARDAHYKHIPGLGEERFPVYLGLPLFAGGPGVGVLVFQRRETGTFAAADVTLAAALSAPFGHALERSRARRETHGGAPDGERSARLVGAGRSPARALGTAQLVPVLSARAEKWSPDAVPMALAALSRELDRARRRVAQELDDDARRRLAVLALVLEDARFREQVLGAGANLGAVAREYARAIYRVPSGDQTEAWMVERTLEIEDLCLLLSLRAGGERLPRAGAILVGERVSAFSALAAVAARGAGFALGGPAEEGSLGVAIARAAGLAVVAEVAGLFAWIRPGDRLLLDGETGVVRVNPPASAVARFRRRLE